MVNDSQNNLILHEGFDYQENGELPLFTITDNDGGEETFFYGTSNFDYLGIFDGDGDGGADFNGNPTDGFNTYTGFDDNYLVASDIDGSSSTIAPPVFLTWSDLNVNGFNNLIFSADLATEDSDEALDFDDFVIFEYRVDGGVWQPLLAFETADDSSFNQNTFLEDTDFDGIGDGTSLTSSAQTFVKNLAVNGTNLDLRLQIRLEAGREDIGIDNISLAPLIGSSFEISATDAEKAEGNTGVTEYTFTVTRSGNTSGEVSVDYTVSGDVDGTDFGGVLPSETITFADGETSKIITLSVIGDTDAESDETVTVTLSNATNNATISVNSANGMVVNDDFNLVKIHEIQGDGEVSPVVGQQFAIEAIVTGDFQGNDFLRGFYVQEEDTDIDDNPFTSEGIFVFDNNFGVDVNVGDKVYITGEVSEFFGETQFEPLSIQITGTGEIAPTEVMLPVATVINADGRYIADLEAYEGMLVNFPDTLTISEMFNLDRFGEFRAIQGDRAFQFTQINEPDVDNFDAHLQDVASRTITIDDGKTVQNPNPIIFPDGNLDTADSFRMGDAVNNLTGVVRFSRGSGGSGDETFRIMPTENPEFEQVNPRPETPEDVGGRLKVASFNPLNFFTTIDDGQTDTAVGQSPRGADDLTRFGGNPPASDNPNAEFERQLDKLLTTLVQLDADVIGLQELENYFGSDSEPPIATLVNALNERLGADIYAYVDPGMDFLGTDAIAVGAIYRQDTVRIAPNTTVAYLDDTIVAQLGDLGLSGEPLFTGEATSRVPLAVTFEEIATGETFTVTVNHFKSKGSSGLNDPNNPNFDQLDGQGFWNFRRTETAIALNAWLRTNPTGSNDQDVLILGDLNAYAQEDPIKTLENNYINLIKDKIGDSAYSYVFDGQLGTLDYALASPRLAQQVTGVTEWQINSDEADALDYNLDFGRDADIFDGSVPYRTSDHDPLIVGLNLDDNLRVATFNASLNRNSAGELIEDLSTLDDAQAQKVAEIIQRANPDIILLNEFDYDANGDAIRLFQENYLGVSQNGVNPVEYPYVYFAPSNTGIASGFDLDNNGAIGGAGDAFGFGNYEGQYGMVLLSKYPIMEEGVRTFQEFLWKDMPNNLLTNDPTIDDPNTEVNENLNGYYSPEEIEILRLSSKSHWDVPVNVNGEIVHILAAHPTPPVFDGTEDRNGKRNFDEIRFWSDYVNPTTSDYIYDDQGNTGGLSAGERFVIVGDYNADPFDGDSFPDVNASDEVKANYPQAINQLLNNPIIQGSATDESITPISEGGVDASIRQNGANDSHTGNPAFDTADFGFNFNDPNSDIPPGNLRVDYVLPSYNLEIVNAEVFWKPSDDPLFDLAEFPTSDHRLVYVDLNSNNSVIAQDDTITTQENSSVSIDNLLDNDSDTDGDNLVIKSINSSNTIGLVTLNNDGTVTYNPDGEFESLSQGETATTTFEYTITDNRGGVDTAIVTITIEGVNDNPIAVDDELIIDEDTPDAIALLTNDTDIDGDDLTITEVTNGENGTVTNNNDGTVTYTPNTDFNGEDSFTYTISDGNGGTDTATVNVTVNSVNDNPMAVDDELITDEDTPDAIALLTNDTDIDGDDLTVTEVTNGENGTVTNNNDGTVTYTPNADFNGEDSFTYTISDGNGGTDTATVNVTVNPVNDENINFNDEDRELNLGDDNYTITGGNGNNIITTGNGNNVINLGNGNNQVTTGDGDDDITTGSGSDRINPAGGNNIVNAGAGDDVIIGSGQNGVNNQIDGGEGFDTVIYDGAFNEFSITVENSVVTVGTNTDTLTNVEQIQFSDRTIAVDDLTTDNLLNTSIYRFRTGEGTYIYVENQERQRILQGGFNFVEEGEAFKVALEDGENLEPIYRFRNSNLGGAYLYVGEAERQSIKENYTNFIEEGLAFYTYGADAQQANDIFRFQTQPGGYIFVGDAERQSILDSGFNFTEEGTAFEALA
ncbi:ExeM/NucH family extracellular endonuclease [Cyanobacterium aponinum AL20118]|uniref:ExeM/NucH family extracellular endonuclease n=1 Tax=Cyanobacterium aponinum AL20115 TaxID=3090662 RepID=A0AAF0Z8S0_9CHRO|nr:ExeM/NucH family extracellular endonuclease [Cyanobacterium aponinum]WPF87483.1 ExeM/NucH family extracellular endonuclease [Cyanobacterium aponinum AL20115]